MLLYLLEMASMCDVHGQMCRVPYISAEDI